MSRDVKKLQERIPFTKAADIEKSMVAKHGAAETYGPGTFGVEFEIGKPKYGFFRWMITPNADEKSIQNRSELISTIGDWIVQHGEKVSDDEQGHKDEWGVGTDGDNIEIRTKHMRNEDVDTLVELMNWMRRNHFIVSGGTRAPTFTSVFPQISTTSTFSSP